MATLQTSVPAVGSSNKRRATAKPSPARHIVGIGASAGGLEALQVLVKHLPSGAPLCYVIAQHLSPTHRSMMVELLSRHATLPVEAVTDGRLPEAGLILVTPPDKDVFVEAGLLRLRKSANDYGPKPSIDHFFATLAAEFKERAIGIILSGTGSDGSHGMRAIKAAGGITIAQEPESALYQSMPQSAMRLAPADLVLAPDQIGSQLAGIATGPRPVAASPGTAEAAYRQILDRMRSRLQVDFRLYKRATLRRQLERRLTALQLPDLAGYCEFVEREPAELDRLLQRFLISVTSFFRDHEHFEALRVVLRAIIERAAKSRQIRIWVPACASGEEPYSIAILLREELGAAASDYEITIFATDIDPVAMETARVGIYPEAAVAGLGSDLVGRYFEVRGRNFVVRKFLREQIIFARHDLVQDPPFLQVDLVSCRNLLIYFQNDLQTKVLAFIHYALREGGYLFLGKSETVGKSEDLFVAVDARHHIYQRRSTATPRAAFARTSIARQTTLVDRRPPLRAASETHLHKLLAIYAPPTALVDDDGNCLNYYADFTAFSTAPRGVPSVNLLTTLVQPLRMDLRHLLQRARERNEPAIGMFHPIDLGGASRDVRVVVRPAGAGTSPGEPFFVSLESRPEAGAPRPASADGQTARPADADVAAEDDGQLARELGEAREHLQSVVEQLETTNEELAAVNEEMQASAEELQASNEELETANEELQASNEELATVNAELQNKTSQLTEVNDMLENLQVSLDLPLVMVDTGMNVVRFTPQALFAFHLKTTDIGRPFSQVRKAIRLPGLQKHLAQVIRTGRSFTMPLSTGMGKSFQLRLTPYLDSAGQVNGALLTLVDITELARAQADLVASEARVSEVFRDAPLSILEVDHTGVIRMANRRAVAMFGYEGDGLDGLQIEALVPDASREAHRVFRQEFMQAPSARMVAPRIELWARRRDGSLFPAEVSLNPVRSERGLRILAGVVDVSMRKELERALKERAEVLDERNVALRQFAYLASHDLQEPLRMISGHLQLLVRRYRDRLDERAMSSIDFAVQGARRMHALITGLLAYSRVERTQPSFVAVDVNEIVDQLKVDLSRLIRQSGAQIEAGGLPRVFGDPVLCRQLMQNLIVNAIKFRGAQPPRIVISASEDADFWRFEVRDNGVGIAPEHRDRVFELFQRLPGRQDDDGEGLGLAICRRITDIHGGRIEADEAPGGGTCMRLWLPKVPA